MDTTTSNAMDPLIEAEDLHNLLLVKPTTELVVIGMTPKWRFVCGHIPHSFQAWRRELNQPGSELLLEAEAFSTWSQKMGVNLDTHLVIWDERYDACRLWWAFQHYGHRRVQVLNGGLASWTNAGFALARGRQRRATQAGTFKAIKSDRFAIASCEEILASKHDNGSQLWVCRDLNEWQGRKRKQGAAKAGRIPWACHLPWQLFRSEKHQGYFFSNPRLVDEVICAHNIDKSKQQLFYCQSGVRTTVALLALYRQGWSAEQLINYDGSWREWSQGKHLPSQSD